MILFRPQRGALADSMKEVKRFNSFDEMKRFLVREYAHNFSESDVVVSGKPVYDSRINWKATRYVCVKKFAGRDYIKMYGCPQAIGYCSEQND